MFNNQSIETDVNKQPEPQITPNYQKPQTSLFLDKAEMIQGGDVLTVLESQGGAGYLS